MCRSSASQRSAELLKLTGPHQLALLTVMLEDPQGYGRIVRAAGGRVQKIVEQQEATAAQRRIRECNTGVLACPAPLLRKWLARLKRNNSQGEYYLTDIIAMAVKEKIAVRALLAREASEVLGVNDKAQLAQLEALCRARGARELLLAGVTLADPARIDVRGSVTHGSDVFIDVNVVLEGKVALGDRVRIGAGCVIRNSEIGADTEVFAHCVIDGALIGPDCRIGPFARLRPTAALAASVHIGNFVEVKNSQLGESSKANHLAYVGDAAGRHSRQRRRRHHHCELRRRQQAAHAHRGRRAHRLQQRAGRPDHRGSRRHHRRRLHRDARGARRKAHHRPRPAGERRRLAASGEAEIGKSQPRQRS